MTFNFSKKIPEISFYLILIIWVISIWSVEYFLTGDGPCHVYNSRVMLDFLRGHHLDFYNQWYVWNDYPMPNWVCHFFLMGLQTMFSGAISEKIFLTIYVLTFGFGFRLLVRAIHPEAGFLAGLGAIFAFHNLLAMGFYNFSFSLAGMFWLVGMWLNWRTRLNSPRLLVFVFGFFVVYFMHPMGLVFSIISIGAVEFGHSFFGQKTFFKEKIIAFFKNFSNLILATLPAVFAYFLFLKVINFDASYGKPGDWDALFRLHSLQLLNFTERDLGTTVAVLIAVLLLAGLFLRLKNDRRVKPADFFLLVFGFVLFEYAHLPSTPNDSMMMADRLRFLPYIFALIWLANVRFPRWIQTSIPVVAVVFCVVFAFKRIPAQRAASDLVSDYMTCLPQIADTSVVLILNYDWHGSNLANGKQIGTKIWMFTHALDYLGTTEKSLILCDNYEANNGWFPLKFKWKRSTFWLSDKDGSGVESHPCRADIANFEKKADGVRLDYVLMVGYDQKPEWHEHEHTKEIWEQLKAFDLVFTSPAGRARLFKKR